MKSKMMAVAVQHVVSGLMKSSKAAFYYISMIRVINKDNICISPHAQICISFQGTLFITTKTL